MASISKNGAPVNIYLYLKVYLQRTRKVPITEETDVAIFTPKTNTMAGAAVFGAADGNDASLRGVTYYSRITYVLPFCCVWSHAVALVCPSQ